MLHLWFIIENVFKTLLEFKESFILHENNTVCRSGLMFQAQLELKDTFCLKFCLNMAIFLIEIRALVQKNRKTVPPKRQLEAAMTLPLLRDLGSDLQRFLSGF